MSAHVLPKAKSVAVPNVEDERTAIESGWEEEASTTVEQGGVADKFRALGLEPPRPITNVTSTSANGLPDEPTVDDQRASAAIAMLPPPVGARLVITAGNDQGQSLEVRAGKTYTIGRGIDNDLVLTDMTVSRKHFDLRHEHGAWVLADRGSGNGTLVNHRIEDAPFLLTSGDVIEIGNTSFRFELPTPSGAAPGPPRELPGPPSAPSAYRGEPEPEPARPLPEPAQLPPPRLSAPSLRPKTLPPPSPRSHPQTGRPPMGYPPERPGASQSIPVQPASAAAPGMAPASGSMASALPLPGLPQPLSTLAPAAPQPASTLPLPQMAARPRAPLSLGDPPLAGMPSAIPGQSPPLPRGRQPRLPFSYPSSPDLPAQHAPNLPPSGPARGSVPLGPGRAAPPTSLVPPMAYSTGQPAMPPPGYRPAPQLSRRMNLMLAGLALAVIAAVATIAIINGTTAPAARSASQPPRTSPTVEPIGEPGKAVAPSPGKDRAVTVTPIAPPGRAPTAPTAPTPDKLATHAPASDRKVAATPETPAPAVADKPDKPVALAAAPAPVPRADPTPPTPKPDKLAAAAAPSRTDKKADKKPDRKADQKSSPARSETRTEPRTADKPEVAAKDKADKKRPGRGTRELKNEADGLYRAKNFAGAAQLISGSLSSYSGDDAKELRSLGAIYSQLGKAYNVGMAPATKPTDAYQALRRAINYDRDVGGAYSGELVERLANVAARAAGSYMAAKDYESAFQAVRTSESYGSTSPSNKTVRSMLEGIAAGLYRAAQGELASSPESAKQKLHQVLGIVDAKHPLHGRAQKLLNGS